jgi:MFS family permease
VAPEPTSSADAHDAEALATTWRPAILSIVAMSIGSFGGMVATTALAIQLFNVRSREADLGFLGLAEFVPGVALVLVTGLVADRFDRRRIGSIVNFFEGLLFLSIAAFVRTEPTKVLPFFVFAALFGVCRSFAAPALRSLIPASAPAGQLERTTATMSLSWQGAFIVGPVVGALANKASRPLPHLIAGGCLVTSAALIQLIPRSIGRAHLRRPAGEIRERPSLTAAMEGFRFIRRTPILLAAISLDLFAVLFGGAVALLPAIVEKILKVDDVWVGYLRACGGIGAALVTISLAWRPLSRHVGRVLLVSVGVFGLATVLLGVTRSVWLAALAFFLLNAGDSVSVFVRTMLVPLVTPPEQRGRVLATESIFIGASNELGAFESGMAAALFGTTVAVVSGGAATLAIVGVFWFAFPTLRHVDRFSDLQRG